VREQPGLLTFDVTSVSRQHSRRMHEEGDQRLFYRKKGEEWRLGVPK
jgi:hypothetical protein